MSIFPCAYWPSVWLLWRNVYLGLLRIFQLGCFCCYWVVWAANRFILRLPSVIALLQLLHASRWHASHVLVLITRTSGQHLPCAKHCTWRLWVCFILILILWNNDYFHFVSKETSERLIFNSKSVWCHSQWPYLYNTIHVDAHKCVIGWAKSKSPVAQLVECAECRRVLWPKIGSLHMDSSRIFAS